MHESAAAGLQALRARGVSPVQRAREKQAASLEWIYRWGYTSPSLLQSLTGSTRRGIAQTLARRGLAELTPLPTARLEKGEPRSIVTLTEDGVSLAQEQTGLLLPYDTEPTRAIHFPQVAHDLLAQISTFNAVSQGIIEEYKTPRELAVFSTRGQKQPDALWINGEMKIALEVELSPKWDRDLDQFIYGHLIAVRDKRWNRVIIAARSEKLLQRYRQATSPQAQVNIWEKDERRHWSISRTITLNENSAKIFDFIPL